MDTTINKKQTNGATVNDKHGI